jgi:hypothetical protein
VSQSCQPPKGSKQHTTAQQQHQHHDPSLWLQPDRDTGQLNTAKRLSHERKRELAGHAIQKRLLNVLRMTLVDTARKIKCKAPAVRWHLCANAGEKSMS